MKFFIASLISLVATIANAENIYKSDCLAPDKYSTTVTFDYSEETQQAGVEITKTDRSSESMQDIFHVWLSPELVRYDANTNKLFYKNSVDCGSFARVLGAITFKPSGLCLLNVIVDYSNTCEQHYVVLTVKQ